MGGRTVSERKPTPSPGPHGRRSRLLAVAVVVVVGLRAAAVRAAMDPSPPPSSRTAAAPDPPRASPQGLSPGATPTASIPPTPAPIPGFLMIADRGNERILLVNSQKRVVWRYPTPGVTPSEPFYFDD